MKRFFTVWFVVAVSTWVFADSRVTTYTYDALGNVTVQTDAQERSQQTIYDVLGRPVGQVDALGHTNTVSYGPSGQMEGLLDANGNQTAWAFDPLGQLLTKTYDDNTQVHYTYDGFGRLESRLDANGGYTTYQYDALGQLRTNRFYTATNGTLERTVVYTYDNIGRMLTADLRSLTSTNLHTITYDDTQNKQTVTVDYGSGVTMPSVYSYNRQTKQMTRVNGGVTNIYSYNADGQLLSVSIPGEGLVSYQYDAGGLNTEIILPGGIRRVMEYDGFGQLESVQVLDAASNNVLSQSYQRSLTGSILQKQTDAGAWAYGYDLTDQLTNALLSANSAPLRENAYSYDPMGNRVQVSEVRSQGSEVTDYSANNLNQYLSATSALSAVNFS